MFEVIFDLETKAMYDENGKFEPANLGVSIVSLYHRRIDDELKEVEGKMMSFWEKDFENMWKVFLEADRIVGFNSLGFDVPALSPYAPAQFAKLPHFDILQHIRELTGHRTSLHRLAKSSLGLQKIDTGENATKYWQRGDPESLKLLLQYCEKDVELTRDLYDYGVKNKVLRFTDFWNNPREAEVDFSYPNNAVSSVQSSLF